MGKTGRKSKHDKKMANKRAMKAQRKAAYAALAGTSTKKKKQGKKSVVAGKSAHPGNCGNVGCKQCFPRVRSK